MELCVSLNIQIYCEHLRRKRGNETATIWGRIGVYFQFVIIINWKPTETGAGEWKQRLK